MPTAPPPNKARLNTRQSSIPVFFGALEKFSPCVAYRTSLSLKRERDEKKRKRTERRTHTLRNTSLCRNIWYRDTKCKRISRTTTKMARQHADPVLFVLNMKRNALLVWQTGPRYLSESEREKTQRIR